MTLPTVPHNAELLRTIPLFAGIDGDALEELADHAEVLQLLGGETLMREGDPSDALFVVVSGRLQAFVASEDDPEVAVGEIGRGEVIGEMGILGDEPRSATVRAVRDSSLLRFSKDRFLGFLHEHPEELFAINQLIIQRLRRSIRPEPAAASIRTIAVVPIHGASGQTFARHLTSMFSERRIAHLVRADDVDESVPDEEMTRFLHELESTHDLLVYLADPHPSSWTKRCLRQADRVLLVADAEGDTALSDTERALMGRDGERVRARIDLVLVHPGHEDKAHRAVQWLQGRPVRRHYHVRLHSRDDLLRLTRSLSGREIGLVLSGGGARGLAHVGIFKALQESGIPIDVVGGSSFGSIAAGYIAKGYGWREQRDSLWENLVSKGSVVDLTAPAVSLATGQRVTRAIRAEFEDTLIENLWLPFFCLSSNLSRGEVTVHDRGATWKAMRASVSIPGLWPPVRSEDGDILVDGGVMNNLPVDVMETFFDGGAIIAVNLKGTASLASAGLPESGVMSGWGPMARRFNPLAESTELPGIIDVLLRSTETGNVLAAKRMEAEADVVLHPEVAEFGLLAFEELDRVIDAGYRYAIDQLPKHADLLNGLL